MFVPLFTFDMILVIVLSRVMDSLVFNSSIRVTCFFGISSVCPFVRGFMSRKAKVLASS